MVKLQDLMVDILLTVGKFLKKVDDSSLDDVSEITFAALLNDLEMLEHYFQKYDKNTISKHVALSGNLKALKWVISQRGCPMIESTSSYAASSGNLSMLQWLHERGCPWDYMTPKAAAERGDLDMLRYLIEQGRRWSPYYEDLICASAARNGHLHILKYLHEQGFLWYEDSCLCAAQNGHLHVLKYLREHGCPWSPYTIYIVATNGHADVLKWALDNGCPGPRGEQLQRLLENLEKNKRRRLFP
jgi:hypothetical protein